MNTFAQKTGAFDVSQEERLEELRRVNASLLIERKPVKPSEIQTARFEPNAN